MRVLLRFVCAVAFAACVGQPVAPNGGGAAAGPGPGSKGDDPTAVPTLEDGGFADDAGLAGDGVDPAYVDAASPSADDAGATCVPPATPGSATMGTGKACLSCHPTGIFKYRLGGTLYLDSAGSGAVGGATVEITDATGRVVTLVTGVDGNFYSGARLTYPVAVTVSSCPATVEMPTPPPSGDCNSCHAAGNRIHLP